MPGWWSAGAAFQAMTGLTTVTTERTMALSDGVFAIALTLLVLDLHAPDPHEAHLLRAFLHEWPSFVAYGMGFLTIGICWVNHHALFSNLTRVDRPLLFINLNLLLFVSVIPFPTSFLAHSFGEHAGEHAATLLFGGAMVTVSSAFAMLWVYVARHQNALLKPGSVDVRERLRRTWLGVLLYSGTTVIALFSAPVGLVAFLAVGVYYIHSGLIRLGRSRADA